MRLFLFLKDLLTSGSMSVEGQLSSFADDDLEASAKLLKDFYNQDILNMPATAPSFSKPSAIWAAKHMYLSLQLTLSRDFNEEVINEHLLSFTGEIVPEIIYSADLVLRYLPSIFKLAKGLAPADIIVTKMAETATQWPFSSVGMAVKQPENDSIILVHPSLKIEYADRIVKAKDFTRITSYNLKQNILEALGNYSNELWPGINELLSSKTWN